ncbi:MAG: PQQ-binding-like beta-propeller repeat protein [Phycisphaerae bacterium]|jgi:outer membrane protein assembly factor BamB|nr:PQQ-binding-like beta-propeller repeat protein [Phycisphaerae bacterium]
MMHFKRTFFSCILLVAFCAAADAQEWTRFRGPDGKGIGQADGIPAKIDESSYAWKVKLPGPGHSSPVLWGKKIFLTCEGPGKIARPPRRRRGGPAVLGTQANRQLVCLSAADGKVLWTWKDIFTTYSHNGLNSFAASTPAVDAERVYLTWASGGKYFAVAIDHEGKRVWRRELGDFSAKHGAGASPVVIDGVVLVGNDHAGKTSTLNGLDAKTGKTLWKIDRKSGPASYIVPAICRPAGGKPQAIFVSCAEGVTSVNPSDGKINWRVQCNFTLKAIASPVSAGGLIFVSTGRGGGRESAVIRPPSGAKKASIAFKLDKEVPYVPTPIAVGDYLFVLNDNGTLTCIEPATGKKLWREKLSGVHYPSPVCIDDRIYVINNKGDISTIAAAAKYKLLATSKLPEATQSTPAVANGCMYIRTVNHLICVGSGK